MWQFICLEGIDGVGKTTVARIIARHLGAVYYKSPGGKFAETRHMVDSNDIEPLTRYFFYRAATQYDSESIKRILRHSTVVCDRYIYSTFAFHIAMDPRVESLIEMTGLMVPDYTFLLTANEKVRLERLGTRSAVSNLEENTNLQRKANRLFLSQGHVVIDTSHITACKVADNILDHLKQKRST